MHIVVLNDGETYTDLNGCKIVWVADYASPEDIEDFLSDLKKAENEGHAEVITNLTY